MRTILRLSIAALAGVTASAANAQTDTVKSGGALPYLTGDPATWPKESDAVVAAPGNHKVLLENDSVRVLQVSVAPGTTEPLHSHRWPSVLYVQEAGNFVDRDAAGKVVFDTRKLVPTPKYPFAMYKEPEAPHSIENLSKTVTIRLIRVEMKKN